MSPRWLDDGDETWERWFAKMCDVDLDVSPLTMFALESHLDAIIERLEYLRSTITNKELAYRGKGLFGEGIYDEFCTSETQLEIAYQILAILILETGSYLPDKVRDEVLKIIDWDNDKKWGWDPEILDYRRRYLSLLRIALELQNNKRKKWKVF